MKILKLMLNNFQGIKKLTLNLDGSNVSIYGDNATGKTTVFNSLTWLLFDKSSTNTKNFSPKTKGEDGDLHNLDHSVEAVVETLDGAEVILKKVYKEIWTKKRGSAISEFSGHTTDYYINEVPVQLKEYTSSVRSYLRADAEQSKMLTMPHYFAEEMNWEARRNILLQISGDISDEDVIESNKELAELKEIIKQPGTDNLYNIEDYKKIATSKKNEINKQIQSIPARIDEAVKAMPDMTGIKKNDVISKVASLNKKKMDIEIEINQLHSGNLAEIGLNEQIATAHTKLAQERTKHLKSENKDSEEIDNEVKVLRSQIRDIEDMNNTLESGLHAIYSHISKVKQEKAEMESLRIKLRNQYIEISNQVWDESKSVCPTCRQDLQAEKIINMQSEFNQSKSNRLEEINNEGKSTCNKEMIAELEKEISDLTVKASKAQEKIEANTSEILKIDAEISRLRSKLKAPVPFNVTQVYQDIREEIANLESSKEDKEATIKMASNAKRNEVKKIIEELENLEEQKALFALAEGQRLRVLELEADEKRLSKEYEQLEKGLYLCENFIKAKVSMLDENINSRFNSVKFRLFNEQINGGIKEDCEVMIPGPNNQLVPYSFANNAAKINAGLEIINALSDAFGAILPIFIDNAESVTKLIDSKAQLIRLVVSENDKKLRMEK